MPAEITRLLKQLLKYGYRGREAEQMIEDECRMQNLTDDGYSRGQARKKVKNKLTSDDMPKQFRKIIRRLRKEGVIDDRFERDQLDSSHSFYDESEDEDGMTLDQVLEEARKERDARREFESNFLDETSLEERARDQLGEAPKPYFLEDNTPNPCQAKPLATLKKTCKHCGKQTSSTIKCTECGGILP